MKFYQVLYIFRKKLWMNLNFRHVDACIRKWNLTLPGQSRGVQVAFRRQIAQPSHVSFQIRHLPTFSRSYLLKLVSHLDSVSSVKNFSVHTFDCASPVKKKCCCGVVLWVGYKRTSLPCPWVYHGSGNLPHWLPLLTLVSESPWQRLSRVVCTKCFIYLESTAFLLT